MTLLQIEDVCHTNLSTTKRGKIYWGKSVGEVGNDCSHFSSLVDSVEDAREASWGVPYIGLTKHYACHLAIHSGPIHVLCNLTICGVLCNAALSLSKYMHLRLLLDFNMRLCVTLVVTTLVSPGVPLQSRMKIGIIL